MVGIVVTMTTWNMTAGDKYLARAMHLRRAVFWDSRQATALTCDVKVRRSSTRTLRILMAPPWAMVKGPSTTGVGGRRVVH